MIRIILTEQNFKDLTAGKAVKINEGEDHIEMILSDIGYLRMSRIIVENYNIDAGAYMEKVKGKK